MVIGPIHLSYSVNNPKLRKPFQVLIDQHNGCFFCTTTLVEAACISGLCRRRNCRNKSAPLQFCHFWPSLVFFTQPISGAGQHSRQTDRRNRGSGIWTLGGRRRALTASGLSPFSLPTQPARAQYSIYSSRFWTVTKATELLSSKELWKGACQTALISMHLHFRRWILSGRQCSGEPLVPRFPGIAADNVGLQGELKLTRTEQSVNRIKPVRFTWEEGWKQSLFE